MVRAPYFDKNGLKKGAWSKEEDDKLRAYVEKYGHWNWRELPKFAGLKRCGKSCRLRWLNYLRPDVKHGKYSKEEEDLIIKLHGEMGNRWSVIATKLPGRTDNEIKNHWHSHIKKRLMQKQDTADDCSEELQSSCEISQSQGVISQNIKELETENEESVLANTTPSHTIILDSFTSSSPEASSSKFSYLGSDSSLIPELSATDWIVEESNYASFEALTREFSGDFWTEPFVADNLYDNEQDCGGIFMSSNYGSYYDHDSGDLIYQVMQNCQETRPCFGHVN